MFSVEYSSEDSYTGASPNADGIVALESPTIQASTVSSPPTNFHPSLVPSIRKAPTPTSTVPGTGRRYGSGDQSVRCGPPPCQFCLDPTHRQDHCTNVADASLQGPLLAQREASYHKLSSSQGLRACSPFSHPQEAVWRGNPSFPAALINLIDAKADRAVNTAVQEEEDLKLTGGRPRGSVEATPSKLFVCLTPEDALSSTHGKGPNRKEDKPTVTAPICFFQRQNHKNSTTAGLQQA